MTIILLPSFVQWLDSCTASPVSPVLKVTTRRPSCDTDFAPQRYCTNINVNFVKYRPSFSHWEQATALFSWCINSFWRTFSVSIKRKVAQSCNGSLSKPLQDCSPNLHMCKMHKVLDDVYLWDGWYHRRGDALSHSILQIFAGFPFCWKKDHTNHKLL